MEDEILVKKVLNAEVNGGRLGGKQRYGWRDGVSKNALDVKGINIWEPKGRALQRREW